WIAHTGLHRRTLPHQFHAKMPLIPIVEEEEELLLPARSWPRDIADQRSSRGASWRANKGIRLAVERILTVMLPGPTTQDEGPEMGVVEVKGQRYGVPHLLQRLVGCDLDLAPHRTRLFGGKKAAQNAHANSVDRRFRQLASAAWHAGSSSSPADAAQRLVS